MDILLTVIRFALLILLVALYWRSIAHHEKQIDDLYNRVNSVMDLLEQQRQAFTRLRKYIEGELADESKKETS